MTVKSMLLAVLAFCAVHAQSAGRTRNPSVPVGWSPRAAPVGLLSGRDPVEMEPSYTASVDDCNPASGDGLTCTLAPPGWWRSLYLRKATGMIEVSGASSDTYQVYFHIPIPFHEQAPVLLQITCPQGIDYRFIQEDPPNLLVAARLVNADSTVLDWTAWVIVKQNSYPDFPTYVPIPAPEQLPDSVRQWLDTTDCCQVSAPIVQFKADSLRDTTTNLMKLAQDVCIFCDSIPRTSSHEPYACDAVYTLNWGNACTGHAHAAAALLRANGVPARVLMNMMPLSNDYLMHWIIDYYVPGYGWVTMESSIGVNPMQPQDRLVVRACNPGDEFPVWFHVSGVEGEWHSSDPTCTAWCFSRNVSAIRTLNDSIERVDYSIALTDSVFNYYSSYCGILLTAAESAAFVAGLSHQTTALTHIQAGYLPDYLAEMHEALLDYQTINLAPIETLFSEDFENGPGGWTHGGSQDEWELGTPTFGPASAHSGANCWGTNLGGPYANNADCWLLSPRIDLSNLASANLSFWVWNSVQDLHTDVDDPVWVEITGDSATFLPLSSEMGGVNDDPVIPSTGGWHHVFLDLAQYLGDTVRLRFRFRSDVSVVFAGTYIDDVRITGRRASSGVAETPNVEVRRANRLPTVVRGVLELPGDRRPGTEDRAVLLDIAGRKVMRLKPGANDVSQLAPGVYFCRLTAGSASSAGQSAVTKVVIQK